MWGMQEGVRFGMRGDRWAVYDALEDISRQADPQQYLEIGVSHGDSLRVVLEHADPYYISLCDSWGSESGGQGLGGHEHIEQLLVDLGYDGAYTFLDGSSHDLLRTITARFDLILVDGDHSAAGAKQDLYDIWPLLNSGGYVVFDDVAPEFFHPDLLPVWDAWVKLTGISEVYRNLDDKFGEHTLSHGVVVGRKNANLSTE